MTKFIAFTMVGLSSLVSGAGNVEAGCGSGGGWAAPTYHQPYYAPVPDPAIGPGSGYRSFSYEPGAVQPRAVQPGNRFYEPFTYSAPSSSNMFRADRKVRGL